MHDVALTIATAPQRYAKIWKHTETTWVHLVERLRSPIRTGETVAEYKVMRKADRDNRKDVGGFVVGRLKDGKRLKQNVLYRQAISLDADTPGKDFLDDVDLALGNIAWAAYSTHSSTPKTPRLRILIPLTEKVTPDQYQACARMLAKDIGIEAMDDTTYEPERLMYWPSAPKDGEYIFHVNDAPILDPETVLGRYDDWRDSSTWPTSQREAQVVRTAATKQGDPLEKPGLIGAFCRAYSIADAIAKFLPEVYTATSHPDRYTYADGSTSGGLVVYDGKFAYSHHSTDPVSGKLRNAWDLVRLHLYGPEDENAPSDTPPGKLPSFKAMEELALSDQGTIHERNAEKREELRADFAAAGVPVEEQNADWMDKLTRGGGKKSPILPIAQNFLIILQYDPLLKGKFGLDEFAHRLMLIGDLPWRKREGNPVWRDSDDASLRNYLSTRYDLAARQVIDDALTEVMRANAFHPVRQYLDGLTWDKTPRAETVYIDWLGAEDSSYVREVTRIHLKAAVARVMTPGVKFDPCIVLSGPQGIGKSTILRKLGQRWFNDSIVSIQGKDAMEALQGSWIIELQEMQAVSKAENDLIKAFISRTADKFRAPYGRRTEEFPRQGVFAATTNDYIFLKDRTGGRRFWPVMCSGEGTKTLDELTDDVVGQIWAEVYEMWKKDTRLTLTPETAKTARELQEAHTEGSEKAGLIQDYLEKRLPSGWDDMELFDRRNYLNGYGSKEYPAGDVVRQKVCNLEIWCEALNGRREYFRNADARELTAIMMNMRGWKPRNGKLRFGNLYGAQWAFIRDN